jgi:NADPH2:quinone reductase
VLVHAGSSAVGSIAIQLLRARGAHVIASGTRPDKFGFMTLAGAHQVVSTRDPGWAEALAPLDGVFDLVGRATFAASVHALAPGGRLVFVGGTSGGELALSGWDLMRPVTVTGYSTETLTAAELQAAMDELAGARVRCLAVAEFPLAEAHRAHQALESGALSGRVVLRPE